MQFASYCSPNDSSIVLTNLGFFDEYLLTPSCGSCDVDAFGPVAPVTALSSSSCSPHQTSVVLIGRTQS